MRDVSFDVLKGIGICFVLVAHSLGGYVHTFAYSFHMPLFFLVAGYFFKQRGFKEAFMLDFKRIMVPFFFSGLLMLLLALAFSPFDFESVKSPQYALEAVLYGNGSMANYDKVLGDFSSIGSVWFLGALFWSRQFYNALSRLGSKPLMALTWGIGCVACIAGQYVQLPYSMIQGLTALPFLWIGHEARVHNLLHSNVLTKDKWGGVVTAIVVLLWFVSTFFGWLDMAQVRWKLYYIPNVVLATGGTYFFYIVSKFICGRTDSVCSLAAKVLAFLGRYSIVLVCLPVVETYCLPFDDIVPAIPMRGLAMIGIKLAWCGLALYASIKVPFLRNIFSTK